MTPEQEQEFYATAIGTIIAGIAYNTDKYANSDYTFISTDVDNKYYKVPHYPLGWAKLYEACGIDEVLKTWDKPYQQGFMTKEHPVFLNMIKVSGAKILSGDLPFDKEQMVATFPALEDFFNKIEQEKNKEYQQIESLFDEALNQPNKETFSSDKKNFIAAVAQLKEHTLQQFKAGHKEFDFAKCFSLANRTKDLTISLMNNNATEAQLEQFKQENKVFKGGSTAVRILVTILATLVGIVAGAVAGFFIAGPGGAVVGGVAGGLSAAAITLGVFATKKSPAEKVGQAANTIIADSSTYNTDLSSATPGGV